MHRNKSVSVHQFAMVPDAHIPRSQFRMQKAYKTTFGGRAATGGAVAGTLGLLYPVYCEEVLPGDTFNLKMTAFCRLSTPLFPVMDNLYLDTFFFFCPNRLVWDNWERFMGDRDPDPTSSISYTIPQINSPVGGYNVSSIYDYFGLPCIGQVGAGNSISHSALPFRMYSLIWNQWFRSQDLVNGATQLTNDGPDNYTSYTLLPRMKRHDYFTGCLPWPLKGGVDVLLPLGTSATVKTNPTELLTGTANSMLLRNAATGAVPNTTSLLGHNNVDGIMRDGTATGLAVAGSAMYPTNLYADLSTATAATVNQLRQSFQIQKLLERDARGGTRYTEIIRAHFGVVSPDARLQRPEYLGGGTTPISISPIPQTSATGVTGGSSPQGNLSAIGTSVVHNNGFTQSFTEHGYVIGMVNVRADLTYQQGMRRHWSRSTRYDYYLPVFAMLGEQAVLSKEIFCDGSAADTNVFGYQERWAEYRYLPSEITGLFKSTSASTIDPWHLAQKFTARPTLNTSFIQEQPPIDRIVAVGASAQGQQFLLDCFFDVKAARPLPLYSVPGLIDHF